MTDDHEVEVSEKAAGGVPPQESAVSADTRVDDENSVTAEAGRMGGEGPAPAEGDGGGDPAPAAPRGIDGESRVVAERSGADTSFPERPLLADPDDARRPPGGGEEPGPAVGAGEKSGGRAPEPEVGPAS
ncbi:MULTISPECIES: hypothetical protein [Streptosporangium]|uniref:Uncharacterized protein n=1 Tax=Streptosporangium brasiliense TaxID=47480 RepID=A0ABT9QZB1_9ACTN|nr:hypothetical protein [Streptosporangium brasiliense]MDP9862316.1 hypothetical protein [Streptosporangium brasiliense]